MVHVLWWDVNFLHYVRIKYSFFAMFKCYLHILNGNLVTLCYLSTVFRHKAETVCRFAITGKCQTTCLMPCYWKFLFNTLAIRNYRMIVEF